MMKRLWIILFIFGIILHPNNMHADTLFQQVGISSSPNPVGSGARAMGMGGAFIAIADDATSASWNPAGLIQLEKPELSIVGASLKSSEGFSSQRHPEISNKGKANDMNVNYFSATYPFRFRKNMVISLNYQRLYDFARSFNCWYDYSPLGRDFLEYRSFRQKGYISTLGLAFAVEITPKFSLGGTLNIWTDKLFWVLNGWEESFIGHGVGTVSGNPVTIDTYITDRYFDFQGINGNLGLLWNMNKYLTFGAVFKIPFDAYIKHENNFTQISTFGPPVGHTVSSQDSVAENLKLRMPLSFGIGLAWRVSDALSFDLDVYRTKWNDYVLIFIDSDGEKLSPIDGRPQADSDVKNTTHVRFGGEYLIIDSKRKIVVPIRAGIFYDPEPSHNAVKDFYGVAIGSGIAYKKAIIDVAYQLRWSQDVDTGNLIVTSRADIYQHLLLVSLIIHFDTFKW